MFKEIAIDPAAVATSYRDFSYIVEKFGVSEGRLIAAFPSKWKRYVYQAAQARLRGKAELSKLEVRLKALSEDTFLSNGRSGEGCAKDWLAAAIAEHKRMPFDTIISMVPVAEPFVIAAQDLDGIHPCLQPNRQWHIEREAEVMGRCCAPLLNSAKRIKLVDPYFDPGYGRFRRPFLEFLKYVRSGTSIDIYRNDDHDAGYISKRMGSVLKDHLPAGVEVHMFFHLKDVMHNRYVLTEAGGMFFQTGLDDKGDGEKATDEVGLLDPAVCAVQWGRYSGGDPVASWR